MRWPDGPECPQCGHENIQHPTAHPKMAYRCRRGGCRKFFSVKTGTVMANSKISYQKWAIAVFLMNVNIKGTSSLRLHRDLGISQKSAWFMAHRVREAWAAEGVEPMRGPVEVDETYVGGKAKNMHAKVRREKITGRGAVDKTPVVGVRDRSTGRVAAKVVETTDGATLRGFVTEHTSKGAMVYSDDHRGYRGLPRHATVRHSVGEYVNGMAHVNGVESFWAGLKRGFHGTHHSMSAKHLHRYVNEFAGRHNARPLDTEAMMERTAAGMVGKRLTYTTLTTAVPQPTPDPIPAGNPF